MASHRYWRAVNLRTYGGDLVLSEFHLLALGVRVDVPATLTANVQPSAGSLSDLKDDNLATAVTWLKDQLRTLILAWDFGAATNVTNLQLGSGDDPTTFLLAVGLQWSDDAVTWTTYLAPQAIAWPGKRAKTTSETQFRFSRGQGYLRSGYAPISNDDFLADAALAVSGPNTYVPGDTLWVGRGYHRGMINAPRNSGKLQIEFVARGWGGSTTYTVVGLLAPGAELNTNMAAAGTRAYNYDGQKLTGSLASEYGSTYAIGDIIGVVADFTAGTVTFYKNGVTQGVAFVDIAGLTLCPAVGSYTYFSTATEINQGITYPVAGASPWWEDVLIKQTPFQFAMSASPMSSRPSAIAETPAFRAQNIRIYSTRRDYLHVQSHAKGIGRISGTVKEKGTPNAPVYRRVRLIREQDALLLREQWSHPTTGAYQFDYIDELAKYTVMSYDHNHNYRPEVADNLTPDLIE